VKVFWSSEFGRFLFAGGIAALANFFSRIFYSEFLSFSSAIVVAYVTGMVTAYVLNRLFVFEKGQHSTGKELAYFTLVNLFAVLQTWAVSMLLYRYFLEGIVDLYAKELAHFIGVVVPVFTSFIGHKYLTFRKVSHD
jgi:putative flippase GtrA